MATPTRKQLNSARAKAQANDANLIYDAISEVEDSKGVMKLGDVLRDTAKTLTSRKIGKMWSELIQNGNSHDKKTFLKTLIEAMVTFEKNHADNHETQVSKLTDEQIEAMLEHEYGISRNKPGGGVPETTGELEEELLGRAGHSDHGIEETQEESTDDEGG